MGKENFLTCYNVEKPFNTANNNECIMSVVEEYKNF